MFVPTGNYVLGGKMASADGMILLFGIVRTMEEIVAGWFHSAGDALWGNMDAL